MAETLSPQERHIHTQALRGACSALHAGDRVYLSGTVYTARDAAHKRIVALLDEGKAPPFVLRDAVIYYAGATPAPEGLPIGACGPTTSGRMDPYAPRLYGEGVCATIGKGGRTPAVVEAICRTGGVYLCAVGGAGALAARSVRRCDVIAFEELGCEAVRRLEVEDFPLLVAIDCHGGSLFGA